MKSPVFPRQGCCSESRRRWALLVGAPPGEAEELDGAPGDDRVSDQVDEGAAADRRDLGEPEPAETRDEAARGGEAAGPTAT